MYQSGEYVLYGVHGVCRVVGTQKQMLNRKRTEFLVLEPLVQHESRFYLPIENPNAMTKIQTVLSIDELTGLLNSKQIQTDCWIPAENQRKLRYRELIGSGDRLALLQMVASLYRFKDAQIAVGKKFHQCDDNFLRDAERLLGSEIALVMGLSQEEARNYLRMHLRKE